MDKYFINLRGKRHDGCLPCWMLWIFLDTSAEIEIRLCSTWLWLNIRAAPALGGPERPRGCVRGETIYRSVPSDSPLLHCVGRRNVTQQSFVWTKFSVTSHDAPRSTGAERSLLPVIHIHTSYSTGPPPNKGASSVFLSFFVNDSFDRTTLLREGNVLNHFLIHLHQTQIWAEESSLLGSDESQEFSCNGGSRAICSRFVRPTPPCADICCLLSLAEGTDVGGKNGLEVNVFSSRFDKAESICLFFFCLNRRLRYQNMIKLSGQHIQVKENLFITSSDGWHAAKHQPNPPNPQMEDIHFIMKTHTHTVYIYIFRESER